MNEPNKREIEAIRNLGSDKDFRVFLEYLNGLHSRYMSECVNAEDGNATLRAQGKARAMGELIAHIHNADELFSMLSKATPKTAAWAS